ncbi:DUF2189 domain-containing protein [Ruegeria arenilitoris]|uniref:DUF2189 domain-containing protein n=1 Tax=Ruegeria arenilitoris TaxID=1173585 RepID=UPI003464B77C
MTRNQTALLVTFWDQGGWPRFKAGVLKLGEQGQYLGAFLSAALFSVTVVAMPLLLDREVDFITAMITSVRVVRENPVVMLGWAAIIVVTMLLSLVPAFLGLIFTLPILGHTTWHLHQRTVQPAEG